MVPGVCEWYSVYCVDPCELPRHHWLHRSIRSENIFGKQVIVDREHDGAEDAKLRKTLGVKRKYESQLALGDYSTMLRWAQNEKIFNYYTAKYDAHEDKSQDSDTVEYRQAIKNDPEKCIYAPYEAQMDAAVVAENVIAGEIENDEVKEEKRKAKRHGGTPAWTSLDNARVRYSPGYDQAWPWTSDVFSMGVVISELIFGGAQYNIMRPYLKKRRLDSDDAYAGEYEYFVDFEKFREEVVKDDYTFTHHLFWKMPVFISRQVCFTFSSDAGFRNSVQTYASCIEDSDILRHVNDSWRLANFPLIRDEAPGANALLSTT